METLEDLVVVVMIEGSKRWVNAIKLSQCEHAGSPLQPLNTWSLVGADLRVCP